MADIPDIPSQPNLTTIYHPNANQSAIIILNPHLTEIPTETAPVTYPSITVLDPLPPASTNVTFNQL